MGSAHRISGWNDRPPLVKLHAAIDVSIRRNHIHQCTRGLWLDWHYDHLPVYTGGNIYFNGAVPCDRETDYIIDDEHPIGLELKLCDGCIKLQTNLYDYIPASDDHMLINTDRLGIAFEPEQKFESPDGMPIVFDRDYHNIKRSIRPIPGPFAEKAEADIVLFQLSPFHYTRRFRLLFNALHAGSSPAPIRSH